MAHQLCVLLYSKYSSKSKTLMATIQGAPVNLRDATGLVPVCIDNESIRHQIAKATTVQVDTVPTILIVYNNGGVEKYEGERAFQWTNQVIQKHMPLPPPEPESRPEAPPAQPESRDQKKQSSEKPSPAPKREPATAIENLDSEEDEGPKRPPVGIRNGAGAYDISDDFGEGIDPNRDMTKHIRTSTKGSGPAGLMATAMAMQKERESNSDQRSPG